MRFHFDSIEEILAFANNVRKHTNGTGFDNEDLARRLGQVAGHNKIAAIKIYREITGEGLRDSKLAIDRHFPGRPVFCGRNPY